MSKIKLHHKQNIVCQAKETEFLRKMRIQDSHNGLTLKTKVIKDKTKYTRKIKFKKSLDLSRDFPYINREHQLGLTSNLARGLL